jgi:S1-C subfamily serine protease
MRRATSSISISRVIAACAVVVCYLPAIGAAQDTRTQLINEAVEAYDNFETARAMQLLTVALNPAIGPTDNEWASGVQLLSQILIEEGNDSLANVWMRWAVRTAPTMRVDPVTYLPEVIQAHSAARSIVAAGAPGDVVTETTWDLSASGSNDLGALRIAPSSLPVPFEVTIRSIGSVAAGDPLRLRPSTYHVSVSAAGYFGAEVDREVLPGVETILRFNLQPIAVADSVLYADAESAALRHLGRVWVNRFGAEQDCGAGVFVGANGLFLTSYAAIRGSESVEVETSDGERISQGVQVASYDVGENLAVLQVPITRADSLAVADGPEEGQSVWGLGYPTCSSPDVSRTTVTRWPNRPVGNLQLADSLAFGPHGGPLIDQRGSVVGIVSGYYSAVPADRTLTRLDEARRNIARQQLMALRDVAERENHLFGAVDLTADAAGAMVRIEPLESWHWPEAGMTGRLPTTFAGPMGRYGLELLVDNRVQDRREFTISPAVRDQLSLAIQQVIAEEPQVLESGGGKKFPWPIALIGAAGAGAAAFFLLGSKDTTTVIPPPPGPGSITITIPNVP